MSCQQCLDKWGQEPQLYGDTAEECIAYYQHMKFHVDTEVIVPWFWIDEVNDYD